MRTALTLVALLTLGACNPPSNQFLNETPATTMVTENSNSEGGGTVPADAATPELVSSSDLPTSVAGTIVPNVAQNPPDPPISISASEPAIANQVADLEDTLADLDALLGSLGSAVSSVESAFEQGE